MQREDSVLSTIIQKIDQNDVSPQISNYFINGEGLLCHLSKRPSRSPRSNTTRKQCRRRCETMINVTQFDERGNKSGSKDESTICDNYSRSSMQEDNFFRVRTSLFR
ncbi:hypothetical protein TNCV_1745711 [Trichonephila clavipes]|nr:hypothetical protein TNCV_1745711 [Trichonephila clavipes]